MMQSHLAAKPSMLGRLITKASSYGERLTRYFELGSDAVLKDFMTRRLVLGDQITSDPMITAQPANLKGGRPTSHA
jgi:hypothetical protein